MAIDVNKAVELFKLRKDMLTNSYRRDELIITRIKATIQQLEAKGIHLVNTDADLMFVVDVAVWQYNNRDKLTAEPEWLRASKNERWMNDRKINEDYKALQAALAEVNTQ